MVFFVAFLWCIAVYVSIIGWGILANKIFAHISPGHSIPANYAHLQYAWDTRAQENIISLENGAFGLALLVLIGGYLSYFNLISTTTNFIVLTIGWFFSLRHWLPSSISKKTLFTLAVFSLLYSYRYFNGFINAHDDLHGYINFPLQMLGHGSNRLFQFNERALFSLGGTAYLQSLLIMNFDPIMAIQTEALGSIIVISYFLFRGKSSNLLLALIIGIFLGVTLHPHANTSSVILSTSLLMLVIEILMRKSFPDSKQNQLSFALLVACLISLKTQNFLFIGILIVLRLVLENTNRSRINFIKSFFTITPVIFLYLLPWLLISEENTGTYLFPVFGKGNHYKDLPNPPHFYLLSAEEAFKSLKTTTLIFLLLISISLFISLNRPRLKISSLLSSKFYFLFIGAISAQLIMLFTIGSEGLRYSYPFDLAIFYFLLISFMPNMYSRKRTYLLTILFCALWYPVSDIFYKKANYNHGFPNFSYSYVIEKRSAKSNNKEFYEQAQEHIPIGASVFVFASEPVSLNYSRNKLFIADSGGNLNPSPGIRQTKSGEELRSALKQHGIEYILYSKDQANYPKKSYSDRLTSSNLFIAEQTKSVFNLIDNIEDLIKYTYFENNKLYVIKL